MIRPQVGGMYDCRAGLRVFITEELTIDGYQFFKGLAIDGGFSVTWLPTGAYCALKNHPHELDIVAEAGY